MLPSSTSHTTETDDFPALWLAIDEHDWEMAHDLIHEDGIDVNAITTVEPGAPTALFAAIFESHVETVDALLKRGADLKIQNTMDDEEHGVILHKTPLEFAIDLYDPKKLNAENQLAIINFLLIKIKSLITSPEDYLVFGVHQAFHIAVEFQLDSVIDLFLKLKFPVDCLMPLLSKLVKFCSQPADQVKRFFSSSLADKITTCIKICQHSTNIDDLQMIKLSIERAQYSIRTDSSKKNKTKRDELQSNHTLSCLDRFYAAVQTQIALLSTPPEENEEKNDAKINLKKLQRKEKKKKSAARRKASKKTEVEIETREPSPAADMPNETEPLTTAMSARQRRATITIMDPLELLHLQEGLNKGASSIPSSATSSQWDSPITTPVSTPATTRAHTPINHDEEEASSSTTPSSAGILLFSYINCSPGVYLVLDMQLVNFLVPTDITGSLTFFRSPSEITRKYQALSQMDFHYLHWQAVIVVNEKQEAFLFFDPPSQLLTLPIRGGANLVYDMQRQSLSGAYFSQEDSDVCYYLFQKPREISIRLGLQWYSQQPLLVYDVCTPDYFESTAFFYEVITLVSQSHMEQPLSCELEQLAVTLSLARINTITFSEFKEEAENILQTTFPEKILSEFSAPFFSILKFYDCQTCAPTLCMTP